MSYKPLKKIIKQIVEEAKSKDEDVVSRQGVVSDSSIAAPFFYMLDQDLESVESFLETKRAEYVRRLGHFKARYPGDIALEDLDKDEVDDLVGLLVELRTQFRKLQWYVEINYKGFAKILKKFDKKLGTHHKVRYMKSIAFASLDEELAEINGYLGKLRPEEREELINRSANSSPDIYAEHRKAILADNVSRLQELINVDTLPESGVRALVSKAMAANARESLKLLLSRLDDWTDPNDLNGRNILHRAVISLGRHNTTDDEFVAWILAAGPHNLVAKALFQQDSHGQTPLHYAGYYGLESVTRLLLKSMQEADSEFDLCALLKCANSESSSPLHLATGHSHTEAAKIMLELPCKNKDEAIELVTPLLFLAAQLGSVTLCEAFINFGVPVNYTDSTHNDETALFVASKLNHVELVKFLVGPANADIELAESIYQWTPLFVAAVDGNEAVADVLLASGARIDKVDSSGWRAMEHACLRGHLDLAKKLRSDEPTPFLLSANSSTSSIGSVTQVKNTKQMDNKDEDSNQPAAVKMFGHRYLKDEAMILVTLGSSDIRLEDTPVKFFSGTKFSSEAPTNANDTALSLVVSAANCTGDETIIDLPDSSLSSEPCMFYAKDPADVCLYFDLIPTYGSRSKIVGRAAALLSSIYTPLGSNKRSLHETVVLPIVEQATLKVIGSIRFSCLIITPFTHPNMGIEKSATYWKSLIRTRVIGHRGLGKNTTNKSLQLGENTIESFIQAANLGASYVEFDVQLTKDKFPVIYHDFLVAETGLDVPMHSLTLDQFKSQNASLTKFHNKGVVDDTALNTSTSSKSNTSTAPSSTGNSPPRFVSDNRKGPGSIRQRSQSMYVMDEYDEMAERLKHTRDFKIKGFKGNYRGHSIQSPFITLEEAFQTIPSDVGFNIECKYPMLDETENEDMENFAFELNMWVDTVLKCVYDNLNGRDVIFSSFHPDLCVLLAMKQPSIPVLFLTEGGTQKTADIRACSLQEAIRFAKRWNLLGIVSECSPLLMCPRLVRVVKESGLVCVTYGVGNNDPQNAQIEMRAGVDAVIVDSVLAVRKGLTDVEAE